MSITQLVAALERQEKISHLAAIYLALALRCQQLYEQEMTRPNATD